MPKKRNFHRLFIKLLLISFIIAFFCLKLVNRNPQESGPEASKTWAEIVKSQKVAEHLANQDKPTIVDKEAEASPKNSEVQSDSPKTTILAYTSCRGRLGNQLSAFATLYAYEKAYGVKAFLTRQQYNVINFYFEPKEEIRIIEDYIPNWERSIPHFFYPFHEDRQSERLKSLVKDPKLVATTYVGPSPNDMPVYTKYLLDLVPKYFTFKPRFLQEAKNRLEEAKTQHLIKHQDSHDITYVGVHVRRQDYEKYILKSFNGTKFVGPEYFRRAMNIFREEYQNPLFVVVSDSMSWCRENLADDDVTFVGVKGLKMFDTEKEDKDTTDTIVGVSVDTGLDLALLSLMNHTIMSYGTFGVWAGLLSSSGQVLLPAGYEMIRANELLPLYKPTEKVKELVNNQPAALLNAGSGPFEARLIKSHLSGLRDKFLRFKPLYQEAAQRKLQTAKQKYLKDHDLSEDEAILTYVGVHIRRGEYEKNLLSIRNRGAKFVGKDYFQKAFNIFRKKYLHPLFVIVSNGMSWAEENISNEFRDCFFIASGKQRNDQTHEITKNDTVIHISTEIGSDLALLANTNHSILTYGTFGMWGSFLANPGDVIMPSGYEDIIPMSKIVEAEIPGWTFI